MQARPFHTSERQDLSVVCLTPSSITPSEVEVCNALGLLSRGTGLYRELAGTRRRGNFRKPTARRKSGERYQQDTFSPSAWRERGSWGHCGAFAGVRLPPVTGAARAGRPERG